MGGNFNQSDRCCAETTKTVRCYNVPTTLNCCNVSQYELLELGQHMKPTEGPKRMTWRPLHNQHAIERVRLIVQFNEPVPSKVVRTMSENLAKKRNDLRMIGLDRVPPEYFPIHRSRH